MSEIGLSVVKRAADSFPRSPTFASKRRMSLIQSEAATRLPRLANWRTAESEVGSESRWSLR